MNKLKKIMSIVLFIFAISLYSLLVMALLSFFKLDHWLIELIVYMFFGIIWIFPSMYILRPFKKSQIIDQKRIKSILTKVEKAAKSKSADPNLIKSIWKSMIWNFIDYEKKEFKKRK